MKSIYLFCTKLWVYLIELPVILMLCIALRFNAHSDQPLKFYPLISVCAFFIIFIMVYFFRAISISKDEIRCLGLFSSKDSAKIEEGKTLILTVHPHMNIRLELYEDASRAPAFEWMKADDVAHREVCIFRAGATGGVKSARKILGFFNIPSERLNEAVKGGFELENDAIQIKSYKENELLKFKIHFKSAII